MAERRSSRIINDGRTSLEKANDKKKKEDLEDNYNKGKSSKTDKPTNSRMLKVVDKIGISLGVDEGMVNSCLDSCVRLEENRSEKMVTDIPEGDASAGTELIRGGKSSKEKRGW
jgi:hypothetical protein